VVALITAATSIAAHAQTFTTLVNFDGTNGRRPAYEALVQGIDGNLYGTAEGGGADDDAGTVFVMTPQGQLKCLYRFSNTDGDGPEAGLTVAPNGMLYGTTYGGGSNNWGTFFEITPSGTLTTLHNFDGSDGGFPIASVVQAFNGMLYGTTVPMAPAAYSRSPPTESSPCCTCSTGPTAVTLMPDWRSPPTGC
jgi:uncharacterized repeat protein (TIGR03803 family)